METILFDHQMFSLEEGGRLSFIQLNQEKKRAILLLHGLGANGASWQLQFPALTACDYRIIAPDLPGFGNSRTKAPSWSVTSTARLTMELMDHLEIKNFDLAGISLGGVVALEMALDFPNRVSRLVLVNSFACLRPDTMDSWLYLLKRFAVAISRGSANQAELAARRIFPRPDQAALREMLIEQIKQADPKAYRKAMLSLGLYDARRRLKEIDMPTLVISGCEDTTVPLANQSALASGIMGAARCKIQDAGHAVIADQPEAFNQELIRFLQGS